MTTSPGGTQVKLVDVPFSSANVNVPKQNGSVSAGSPHRPKKAAMAPKSSAVKAAHATPNNAERQVNT